MQLMRQLNRLIGRNYGQPRGLVGRFTARMMRQNNAALNLWLVGLLDIAPRSRVLEVGFGPGVALEALLGHAAAIGAGRLEVNQGDAAALPYGDATFDSACGTHVVYFWPDPVATLRELRRVLRPDGTVALGYQQREHMPAIALRTTGQIAARLYGPGEVEQVVRDAGFADVQLKTQGDPASPGGFCVLATK